MDAAEIIVRDMMPLVIANMLAAGMFFGLGVHLVRVGIQVVVLAADWIRDHHPFAERGHRDPGPIGKPRDVAL